MSRRLSYSEKGKGHASPVAPLRRARVKVPSFDNSALLRKHSLTLVGRITNPKIQRVWALIPFFAEHWKVSSRPVGADLGQGSFQFQFASEEDLQKVLDNRPYHYAHWMIILQRWEPTSAKSFPNQIPFWIHVQGIPIHLWSEETLLSIANDIGHLESMEITTSSAKMRVSVDGLQPLITSSMVEFESGEEVEAILVYEKLEKHCTICFCLDHVSWDCPSNPAKEKVPISAGKPRTPFGNQPARGIDSSQGPNRDLLPPRTTKVDHGKPSRRSFQGNHSSYHSRESFQSSSRGANPPSREHQADLRVSLDSSRSNRNAPLRSNDQLGPFNHYPPHHGRWIEKDRGSTPPREGILSTPRSSGSSRQRRPPFDREPSLPPAPVTLPQDALISAMGEIREVMVQYSSCADPSENAARKERIRQAEESGQVEESAAQLVRASLAAQAISVTPLEPSLSPVTRSQDRIPASQRLGPMAPPPALPLTDAHQVPLVTKRKPGRPAGKSLQPNQGPLSQETSSRKRKVRQVNNSPRKRANSGSPRVKGISKARTSGPRTSQTSRQAGTSTSHQPGPSLIIPAIRKKTSDFQSPSSPLP